MQVALPEMDGRLITRTVGFKAEAHYDERCQLSVTRHRLQPERAAFVAELAWRFCRLRTTPNAVKRLALVLANYPNRDGRIGNGVGWIPRPPQSSCCGRWRTQATRWRSCPRTVGHWSAGCRTA